MLAVRSGQNEAYVELVERHYRCVFAVCMGVFGNIHDAEDAAQETMIRGLDKIDTLKDQRQFKCWITSIAKNLCLDIYRQRKRQQRLCEQKAELQESERGGHDYGFDIKEAIAKMPVELRLPLVLYYFENKSAKSIAEMLEISHSGACQRLRRARLKLHELLADQGVTL